MYKDLLTREEMYSDAKPIEEVKWVDPDTKEEVDTGLVKIKASMQKAGGVNVNTGGGNEFGGAEADEGADDVEETKLDQFWNFPSIENEVKFDSFACALGVWGGTRWARARTTIPHASPPLPSPPLFSVQEDVL